MQIVLFVSPIQLVCFVVWNLELQHFFLLSVLIVNLRNYIHRTKKKHTPYTIICFRCHFWIRNETTFQFPSFFRLFRVNTVEAFEGFRLFSLLKIYDKIFEYPIDSTCVLVFSFCCWCCSSFVQALLCVQRRYGKNGDDNNNGSFQLYRSLFLEIE